jgi:hypothetical protein
LLLFSKKIPHTGNKLQDRAKLLTSLVLQPHLILMERMDLDPPPSSGHKRASASTPPSSESSLDKRPKLDLPQDQFDALVVEANNFSALTHIDPTPLSDLVHGGTASHGSEGQGFRRKSGRQTPTKSRRSVGRLEACDTENSEPERLDESHWALYVLFYTRCISSSRLILMSVKLKDTDQKASLPAQETL